MKDMVTGQMLSKNVRLKGSFLEHKNQNMKLEYKFSAYVPPPDEEQTNQVGKLDVFNVGKTKEKRKQDKGEN